MSQGGANRKTGTGASPIETLTGNSGGAVGPDGAMNIDLKGNNATGIMVVGTPGSNLMTVSGIASSTTQIGTLGIATDAEAIAGTVTDEAVVPSSLSAKLGTQTQYGVVLGNTTTGALNSTGTGTSGQVLTSNGAAADPTYQDDQLVLQQVRSTTAALVICNVIIPYDDTIPQNTEGVEVLTLAITPTSSSSILEIEFFGFGVDLDNIAWYTIALFQDSAADALAASVEWSDNRTGARVSQTHYMTAGTASSTTFKIRMGAEIAARRFKYNSKTSGARVYGGIAEAYMSVTEYSS